MAKPKKMTAEERAQQQANMDRARALLIKHGGEPQPVPQPKR